MTQHRLLLVETSGRVGQIGLATQDELLAERTLEEARRHARDLAPLAQAMLQEQGWSTEQLTGVLVSLGPGSYTGLRVGIMSAKTVAYVLKCALIGVPTFHVIAEQTPADCEQVEVIADAQQNKVYVQRFRRAATGDGWEASNELSIVALSDWLPTRDPAIPLSGPGVEIHAERLPGEVRSLAASVWQPGLATLHRLGLRRLAAGQTDDVWSLEPLYLRPSSAEEQWKKLGKG